MTEDIVENNKVKLLERRIVELTIEGEHLRGRVVSLKNLLQGYRDVHSVARVPRIETDPED